MLCLRLGVLASTALLAGIAAAHFNDLCSALTRLRAALFGFLTREVVLVAVHFIVVATLSILSLRRNREASDAPGPASPPNATPDSSFQAAGSPYTAASKPSAPPEETCGSFASAAERRSPRGAGFSPTAFGKPSEAPSSGSGSGSAGKATGSFSDGWHPGCSSPAAGRVSPSHERKRSPQNPFKRFCPGNADPSPGRWSPRSTSPTVVGKPSAPPMRSWESMEAAGYSAGWPHGFSPAAGAAPSAPPEEKSCESMDATWESIRQRGRLSKNNTWGPPARVQLDRSRDAALDAKLMKSETSREASSSSAARSARRSPLRVRTQERPVVVPEDPDEMNRRCEDFINKMHAGLNLERQESFRRRCLNFSDLLSDSVRHPCSSQ